ncbi:MAG: hypothetical protein HQ589_07090 [Syntrophaceae bacterium]|nr:hypothetical protein [Syntrophaceae bacterium]
MRWFYSWGCGSLSRIQYSYYRLFFNRRDPFVPEFFQKYRRIAEKTIEVILPYEVRKK